MAEREATALRYWHPSAVPGLFQTEEYARAMLSTGPLRPAETDVAVSARLGHQADVLERRNPPTVACIVDEAALLRGEPGVLRRQAQHLVALGRRPTISVRVLPLREGMHPGQHGPFALASLPGGATVGYAEGPTDGRIATDVAMLAAVWDTLGAAALPRGATRTFIEGLQMQTTTDLTGAAWRKSSRSNNVGGSCVEVADNLPGVVAVRDTKDRDGGTLTFEPAAWAAFVGFARATR